MAGRKGDTVLPRLQEKMVMKQEQGGGRVELRAKFRMLTLSHRVTVDIDRSTFFSAVSIPEFLITSLRRSWCLRVSIIRA